MRHVIGNYISVVFSFFKLIIMKLVFREKIKFHLVERISPNVVLDISDGSLYLGNRVRAHSGTRITVAQGGNIIIGDDCRINNNCRIACRNEIFIEDGVEFGPGVLIYDHDHDVKAEGGLKAGKYSTSPIKIGKNCWIGANTIILRGTVIGENSVVAAGSILKGNFPGNSIIYQKKDTCIKSLK